MNDGNIEEMTVMECIESVTDEGILRKEWQEKGKIRGVITDVRQHRVQSMGRERLQVTAWVMLEKGTSVTRGMRLVGKNGVKMDVTTSPHLVSSPQGARNSFGQAQIMWME